MLDWWHLKGRNVLIRGLAAEEEEADACHLLDLFEELVDEKEVEDLEGIKDEDDEELPPAVLVQMVEDRARIQSGLVQEFADTSSHPDGKDNEVLDAANGADKTCKQKDKTKNDQTGLLECTFVRPAGVKATCSEILGGVGTTGAQRQDELLDRLCKVEKGLQQFCEYVRHLEGVISPSQVRGSTAENENETNMIRHALAMARQHSMISATRCSRAQAWMNTQSAIAPQKKDVPSYKPRGVETQILAVKNPKDGSVLLGIVLMVFRGSVSQRITKSGKITRRWRVSKNVCSALPATAARVLHVAVLSKSLLSSGGAVWRGTCVSQAWLAHVGPKLQHITTCCSISKDE